MTIEIRKLEKRDNRGSFQSGDIEIDRFFIRFAGQNQFRHKIGTTYVAVITETRQIAGYVTVTVGSLSVEDFDSKAFSAFPKYPLPMIRIARLGVDKRFQSQGIGAMLLIHILKLSLEIEEMIGCIGVFVDAKEDAVAFYSKYGFEVVPVLNGALPVRPKQTTMYLSNKTIHKVYQ